MNVGLYASGLSYTVKINVPAKLFPCEIYFTTLKRPGCDIEISITATVLFFFLSILHLVSVL